MDVSAAIVELLSRNRGPDHSSPPDRIAPKYGVRAELEQDVIYATLTFRSGCSYCCMEWGCHVPLREGRRWKSLRDLLSDRGVAVPDRIQLRLSCVVESEALFFDLSRPDSTRHGWYAFHHAEAHEYQVTSVEAESGEANDHNDG